MSTIKYHAYIGRFQSPHLGHRWLIDRNLAEGKPVLIMIRDVELDEKNPFTASEVYDMLDIAFETEITNGLVSLQIIPDIASINYGRGVGYDVICHEAAAPAHVKRISATEIRRQIKAGEDGWREMVMPGVEEALKAKFKRRYG
jgi:nicotinamide mononucleotide adenylyltransferase